MRVLLKLNLLALVGLAFYVSANPSNDTDLPQALRNFLLARMTLTQSEMQSVISGRAVAKTLDTNTNDEVAIFGIVRINAPMERFIDRFRNIVEFESGTGVEAIGAFHSPPVLKDVDTLAIDPTDLKAIPNCKPGDCDVKLSDAAMERLQKQIPWDTPGADVKAQTLIRQAFVDYVTKYQSIGDDALAVYNDKNKASSVRSGLQELLQNSIDFIEYDPELANYLKTFPSQKPAGAEDIFYWQKAQFGLKPVIRASHLVIHHRQDSYAIASKMLIASHYFRAALELKSLIPESQTNPRSFYLVCLNRSFVDGLTGMKGSLIRGKIKDKSRDSLASYLTSIKTKLESLQ